MNYDILMIYEYIFIIPSLIILYIIFPALMYWIFIRPIRFAQKKALGEPEKGLLYWKRRASPAGSPPPVPVAHPRRVFWMTWARLMLYRSPLIAMGLWLALATLACFVTNASYRAEAVPLIGDLRVKTELFRYESQQLPAVNDPAMMQTFMMVSGRYVSAVASWDGGRVNMWPLQPGHKHFANAVNVSCDGITGRRVRPHLLFYRAFTNDSSYVYAFGVFGDGEFLAARTGYAVLEVSNPSVSQKVVGIWDRYQPTKGSLAQIPLLTAQEWTNQPSNKDNVCWLGDVTTNGLLSADPERFQKALDDLRKAGWGL